MKKLILTFTLLSASLGFGKINWVGQPLHIIILNNSTVPVDLTQYLSTDCKAVTFALDRFSPVFVNIDRKSGMLTVSPLTRDIGDHNFRVMAVCLDQDAGAFLRVHVVVN